MTTFRKEHDSLGEIPVPASCYWGAQTQRSLQNFTLHQYRMPLNVIYALATIKKASALANFELKLLPEQKKELICKVCDEILLGVHNDQFPLSLWQTGSGTQTNMNVNEVIANRGHVLSGGSLSDSVKILHPNDDVNMSQSSNDVFPSAMHMAATEVLQSFTMPALLTLQKTLKQKSKQFSKIIKTGRTHMMDATPITLGQEFSGYTSLVTNGILRLKQANKRLMELALGGTATGTGLNTVKGYDKLVVKHINQITGKKFVAGKNKFELMSAHDAIVEVHAAVKQLVVSLHKISGDIRLMSSGPRCGLNELILPVNEPGSSIMPGKTNPTQIEALSMACAQICGNDVSIGIAAMNGQFELNVYKPVIFKNLLESLLILGDTARSFAEKCIRGVRVNYKTLDKNLHASLMLNTVISNHIGYEKAAKIAQIASKNDLSLRDAALKSGYVNQEEYDKWIDVNNMV